MAVLQKQPTRVVNDAALLVGEHRQGAGAVGQARNVAHNQRLQEGDGVLALRSQEIADGWRCVRLRAARLPPGRQASLQAAAAPTQRAAVLSINERTLRVRPHMWDTSNREAFSRHHSVLSMMLHKRVQGSQEVQCR